MEAMDGLKEVARWKCIDAHQHFWNFDPVRDSWITDDMRAVRRDFTPEELFGVLREHGVAGSVVVQADPSENETAFLAGIASRHDFVKGVVGWVDLAADAVGDRLAYYQSSVPKLRGFRHIVQGEADDFLDGRAFSAGIARLAAYGFTYDILIYPRQLPAALRFVERFPEQRFVIDHLAKPDIKSGSMRPWEGLIREMAAHPGVYCKVSGMVTEADWNGWTPQQLKPYLDVVFDAFGTGRLMFGSDWPVCLVAATYGQVKGILTDYLDAFSAEEQARVMGGNATAFYGLDR